MQTNWKGFDASPAFEELHNGLLTVLLGGRDALVFAAGTHNKHKPMLYSEPAHEVTP